jgi:hypothetical protein
MISRDLRPCSPSTLARRSVDSNLWSSFRRSLARDSITAAMGDEYDARDFKFLAALVERASSLVVLPHVLSEVDNRVGMLRYPGALECRRVISEMIARGVELRPRGFKIVREAAYRRLGLVDAAILRVARKRGCLVLTSDGELHAELSRQGRSTIHYPAIRRVLRPGFG